MNRSGNGPLNALMVLTLALQAVRLGAAVATGDWSHIADVVTICCLAGTVLLRNAVIARRP